MDIRKPVKLAEGLYWIKSFEHKRVGLLFPSNRSPVQYETQRSISDWMADYLIAKGIEEKTQSNWGPEPGDETSWIWHTDGSLDSLYNPEEGRAVLLCILSDDRSNGTLFRLGQRGRTLYSFPWNVYLMHLDIEHRGPQNRSLRYCLRYYFNAQRSLDEFVMT